LSVVVFPSRSGAFFEIPTAYGERVPQFLDDNNGTIFLTEIYVRKYESRPVADIVDYEFKNRSANGLLVQRATVFISKFR